MKVVDMHCDTLYEMEKNHLSLSENNLNIDIKKMEEGDYNVDPVSRTLNKKALKND